jgi:sugar lactone lactonase YvrE
MRLSIVWCSAFPALLIAFVGALTPAHCRADILAGDYATGGVYRFADDGTPKAGGVPVGSAGLDGTAGLAIGADGNIYVSSQNSGEVLFYDGDTGQPLQLPGKPLGRFATLVDATHPFSAPGVLRYGPNGNLVVADFGGSTYRTFHPTTGQELAVAATGFGPPGGLTFAQNGDMFAANFGSSSIIRIQGGTQTPVILSDNGFLEAPASLLFLPSGDLLVVSMFSNRIERYDSSFTHRGTFAEILPLVAGDPEYTNYPSDIVYDADGNLLVSVLGNTYDDVGQVLRYSYDDGVAGTLLEVVLDAQPPLGSVAWIASPDAILGDFDSNGSVGQEDYAKWKNDYGKWVAKGGGADGNGDGIVSAADYTVWRNALGISMGATASAVEAPEPAAFWLACFGTLCLIGRRRTDRPKPRPV